MDATHVESGRVVVIKRVEKGGSEKEIALLMNSDGMTDEKNHSVPILDTFEDELEEWTEFLVMPFLRL